MKGCFFYITIKLVYMNEIIGGKLRIISPIFTFIGFSFGGIVINFQSIWFSDYKVYLLTQVVLGCLIFLVLFFFVETPFHFYLKYNVQGMFESLQKICFFNNPRSEALEICQQLRKTILLDLYLEIKDDKSSKNFQFIRNGDPIDISG